MTHIIHISVNKRAPFFIYLIINEFKILINIQPVSNTTMYGYVLLFWRIESCLFVLNVAQLSSSMWSKPLIGSDMTAYCSSLKPSFLSLTTSSLNPTSLITIEAWIKALHSHRFSLLGLVSHRAAPLVPFFTPYTQLMSPSMIQQSCQQIAIPIKPLRSFSSNLVNLSRRVNPEGINSMRLSVST